MWGWRLIEVLACSPLVSVIQTFCFIFKKAKFVISEQSIEYDTLLVSFIAQLKICKSLKYLNGRPFSGMARKLLFYRH